MTLMDIDPKLIAKLAGRETPLTPFEDVVIEMFATLYARQERFEKAWRRIWLFASAVGLTAGIVFSLLSDLFRQWLQHRLLPP